MIALLVHVTLGFLLGFVFAAFCMADMVVGTIDTDPNTKGCLIEFNNEKALRKAYGRSYLIFKNKTMEG